MKGKDWLMWQKILRLHISLHYSLSGRETSKIKEYAIKILEEGNANQLKNC